MSSGQTRRNAEVICHSNQQMEMQQSLAAAQGANTLSKTDVGGGNNALQLMLGRQAA